MTDFKEDEGLRYLLIKLTKSHYFVVQFNLLTLRLLNDVRYHFWRNKQLKSPDISMAQRFSLIMVTLNIKG